METTGRTSPAWLPNDRGLGSPWTSRVTRYTAILAAYSSQDPGRADQLPLATPDTGDDLAPAELLVACVPCHVERPFL